MVKNVFIAILFSAWSLLIVSTVHSAYAQYGLDDQGPVSVETTYNIKAENKNQIDKTIKSVRDSILKLVKESLDDRIGSNNTDFVQIEFLDELLEKKHESNYENLKSLIVNSLNNRLNLLEFTETKMKISSTLKIQCDNFDNSTADSCLYQLILRD